MDLDERLRKQSSGQTSSAESTGGGLGVRSRVGLELGCERVCRQQLGKQLRFRGSGAKHEPDGHVVLRAVIDGDCVAGAHCSGAITRR